MPYSTVARVVHTFPPCSWLGPVHRFQDSSWFRAILVPVWQEPCAEGGWRWRSRLLWVNIYNFQSGTHYAKKIDASVWERRGWRSRFAPWWHEKTRFVRGSGPPMAG